MSDREIKRQQRILAFRRELLRAGDAERRRLLHRAGLTRREAARAPSGDLVAIVGYMLADGTYDCAGVVAWLRQHDAKLGATPLEALACGYFRDTVDAAARQLGPAVRTSTTKGPIARAMDASEGASA